MLADDLGRADVELRVPADGDYLPLLRTTTAGLAASRDFTLDDLEDLRIAVGEAGAMAVEVAAGDLTARFWLAGRTITIAVSVPTSGHVRIDESSFGWQVLTTLAGGAHARSDAWSLQITLEMGATPLGASY